MFFSVITTNLNWEILTKNLVNFKRWDGVKDEKFEYYGGLLKNPIFRRGGRGGIKKQNIGVWLPKVGLAEKRRGVFKGGWQPNVHYVVVVTPPPSHLYFETPTSVSSPPKSIHTETQRYRHRHTYTHTIHKNATQFLHFPSTFGKCDPNDHFLFYSQWGTLVIYNETNALNGTLDFRATWWNTIYVNVY